MTCMRKVLAVAWLNNLILYLFWVIRGATLTTYRAQIFHELINIRFYFFGKSSDNAIAWSKILLWIICAMHRDESTKPTKPFMLSKFFKYFKFYECWFLLSLFLSEFDCLEIIRSMVCWWWVIGFQAELRCMKLIPVDSWERMLIKYACRKVLPSVKFREYWKLI